MRPEIRRKDIVEAYENMSEMSGRRCDLGLNLSKTRQELKDKQKAYSEEIHRIRDNLDRMLMKQIRLTEILDAAADVERVISGVPVYLLWVGDEKVKIGVSREGRNRMAEIMMDSDGDPEIVKLSHHSKWKGRAVHYEPCHPYEELTEKLMRWAATGAYPSDDEKTRARISALYGK